MVPVTFVDSARGFGSDWYKFQLEDGTPVEVRMGWGLLAPMETFVWVGDAPTPMVLRPEDPTHYILPDEALPKLGYCIKGQWRKVLFSGEEGDPWRDGTEVS